MVAPSNPATRYRIRGINDDADFCECCGRTDLKAVVWIEDTETGEIKHFGRTCAQDPAKGYGIEKKEFSRAARRWSDVLRLRWDRARRAYKAAGGKWVPTGKPGEIGPDKPKLLQDCFRQAGEILVQM